MFRLLKNLNTLKIVWSYNPEKKVSKRAGERKPKTYTSL